MGMWLPEAIKYDIGNTAPMNGGDEPARATHHATSNKTDWTFKNESTFFANGGRAVAPHIVADPFTGEIAQYFPANSRALALQNFGNIKTNRTGIYNIQIEWVFTKNEIRNGKQYRNLSDTPLKAWPPLHTWLKSLGVPDVWPGGPPVAWERDTVPIDTWLHSGGHFTHAQVPGNTHVDPGPMGTIFPKTPPPVQTHEPFPGAAWFVMGKKSPIVAAMHNRLVAVGCNRYQSSANKDVIGSGDKLSYEAWQRKCGFSGKSAEWPPGKLSWTLLGVPNV